jgi:DNA-binding HxlR family transcriptional regulator
MKNNFRSGCPVASTLDIVGDKWSLLIVRDMLLEL